MTENQIKQIAEYVFNGCDIEWIMSAEGGLNQLLPGTSGFFTLRNILGLPKNEATIKYIIPSDRDDIVFFVPQYAIGTNVKLSFVGTIKSFYKERCGKGWLIAKGENNPRKSPIVNTFLDEENIELLAVYDKNEKELKFNIIYKTDNIDSIIDGHLYTQEEAVILQRAFDENRVRIIDDKIEIIK